MVLPVCNPPKLLILPNNPSPEARICTLAHPRTSKPCRYYFDPNQGIYEFTTVAAPKSLPRSWLISNRIRSEKTEAESSNTSGEAAETTKHAHNTVGESVPFPPAGKEVSDSRPISAGYVMKHAEILVATSIDYLFIILPSLSNSSSVKSPSLKGLFLSIDDLLEKLFDGSKHLPHLADHGPIQQAMEQRMQVVCDTVDAGDEKMYRLNEELLLDELVLKAKNMVAKGLPTSMEESFICKALELPIMTIKREQSSTSETNGLQNDTPLSESTSSDTVESQAGSATSADSVDTEVTVPEDSGPTTGEGELYHLLRIRTALTYVISVYIAPALAATLDSLLVSERSPVNFKPLDDRLSSIARMRAEALAARSLGDFSRKRSMYEEDENAESKAEKKRRKEEEEKKKKGSESRGIRDLKKVDTKGMKKMSDFFGKGAATKK